MLLHLLLQVLDVRRVSTIIDETRGTDFSDRGLRPRLFPEIRTWLFHATAKTEG